MDATQFILSHKRTSSTAENLNTEQPPQKQTRQDSEGADSPPGDQESASSSSFSDDEPPLFGVYIVQYSISESQSDANDSRILGVFVSEEDADEEVARQRREAIEG